MSVHGPLKIQDTMQSLILHMLKVDLNICLEVDLSLFFSLSMFRLKI